MCGAGGLCGVCCVCGRVEHRAGSLGCLHPYGVRGVQAEVCRGTGKGEARVAWALGPGVPGSQAFSLPAGGRGPPEASTAGSHQNPSPSAGLQGLSGLQLHPHSLSYCPEQTPKYFCISSGKILGGLFMAVAKQHTSVHSLAGRAGNPGPGFRWLGACRPSSASSFPDGLAHLFKIVYQSLVLFL